MGVGVKGATPGEGYGFGQSSGLSGSWDLYFEITGAQVFW